MTNKSKQKQIKCKAKNIKSSRTDKKILSPREYKIKFLKDDLEHKKRVYDTYIEAIVKYNIKSIAYSAIMCDNLLHNEIIRKMESIRNNKESFTEFLIGSSDHIKTEEEKIKEDIDYYDRLIKYAQSHIEGLDYDTKVKIAKDAIEKGYAWLKLSVENCNKKQPLKNNFKKVVENKKGKQPLKKIEKQPFSRKIEKIRKEIKKEENKRSGDKRGGKKDGKEKR